jgi:hypothetical protein
MYQVKGHALILAASALGVVASFELLDSTGATRALRYAAAAAKPQVSATAPEAAEPVLKPLPASTSQAQYTRVLISPADREMLARNIQRELRRMGCYRGDIDGTWGPQSRQAMGAFTAALKLRIPFDAPDEMMLRLVQGQPQRVCGGPDLDPEQAAATPSETPSPRLVLPPTEMKRAPRRGSGSEAKPLPTAPEAKPGASEAQVADGTPPAARRGERASPAPPPPPSATPAIVRNLMQTVSNVFGPLKF